MRRFGDPRVLGVPRRVSWHLLRVLLLVLGAACAAALLAEPAWHARRDPSSPPSLDLILDFTPGAQSPVYADQIWETFCDSVDSLCALALASRISLYGLGYADGLEIPPTTDAEGLLLVLNGFLPRNGKSTPGEISANLTARLARQSGTDSLRVVVISSRTREDLQRLWLSVPESATSLMVVRMPMEGGAPEFGLPASTGDWIWSGQTEAVRKFIAGRRVRDEGWPAAWYRLSALQAIALAGFLCLLGEFAGPLVLRSRTGGTSVE